jgi:hypothetical protein
MAPSWTPQRLSRLPTCPRGWTVCIHPSHASDTEEVQVLCLGLSALPRAAIRAAKPPCPRGPWLRCELCCLAPSLLTPTPSASPTGTLHFHVFALIRSAFAGRERLKRPVGPSLLSLPRFLHVPSTLRRWTHYPFPLFSGSGTRLPPSVTESPSTNLRLCQQYPAGSVFRRCIVRFMLRPVNLPRPPDWLQRDAVSCSALRLLRTLSPPLLSSPVARCRWGSG